MDIYIIDSETREKFVKIGEDRKILTRQPILFGENEITYKVPNVLFIYENDNSNAQNISAMLKHLYDDILIDSTEKSVVKSCELFASSSTDLLNGFSPMIGRSIDCDKLRPHMNSSHYTWNENFNYSLRDCEIMVKMDYTEIRVDIKLPVGDIVCKYEYYSSGDEEFY